MNFNLMPLIIWITLWYSALGLFPIFFKENKLNRYGDKPLLKILWHLTFIIISYLVYKNNIEDIFKIIITLLVIVPIHTCINIKLEKFINKNKNLEKYNLDTKFYLVKGLDLLIQQYLLVNLILLYPLNSLSLALIFFVIHIPIIILDIGYIKYVFLFGSFFAGFIFTELIINSNYSIIFSYFVHYLFYIIIDIISLVVWIRKNKKIKTPII